MVIVYPKSSYKIRGHLNWNNYYVGGNTYFIKKLNLTNDVDDEVAPYPSFASITDP